MPFIVEQVLLDQNSQTPPPSPFSVQAFNKGASCSAQGFDYGLGNNKGRCLKVVFDIPYFNIFITFASILLITLDLQNFMKVCS